MRLCYAPTRLARGPLAQRVGRRRFFMLRLTDLQLPLNHPDSALREALLERLGVADDQLLAVRIFRRAADARKKSAIHLVYTVDVEVTDEKSVLAKLKPKSKISITPAMDYQFVARAGNLPHFVL
jgi:uncharacterized protein